MPSLYWWWWHFDDGLCFWCTILKWLSTAERVVLYIWHEQNMWLSSNELFVINEISEYWQILFIFTNYQRWMVYVLGKPNDESSLNYEMNYCCVCPCPINYVVFVVIYLAIITVMPSYYFYYVYFLLIYHMYFINIAYAFIHLSLYI